MDCGVQQRHLHANCIWILVQHLRVFRETDSEDQAQSVLKRVHPLFTLRSLAPHINDLPRARTEDFLIERDETSGGTDHATRKSKATNKKTTPARSSNESRVCDRVNNKMGPSASLLGLNTKFVS